MSVSRAPRGSAAFAQLGARTRGLGARFAFCVGLGVLAFACREDATKRALTETARPSPIGASASLASTVPAASSSPTPPHVPLPGQLTCVSGVSGVEPEQRLARLARRCTAGLTPLFEQARSVDVKSRVQLEIPVSPRPRCIKLLVVGRAPHAVILSEGKATRVHGVLAQDHVLPASGVLCSDGDARLNVTIEAETPTAVLLQVFANSGP